MGSYNRLNEYLKNKYGSRTLKICIDGHFTCPNRDGTKGSEGCIFCLNGGSLITENKSNSITNQIESFLSSYKGERADKYIAYFQEYTNTYGTIDELKRKYDEALNASDKFVALDIDTRADCINEEICLLLASYKDKVDVIVELGMQTASEATHTLINQNINNQDIINACSLLNRFGIEIVLHVLIGLPNENHSDIINSINFINKLNVQGIKIHSTYVLKGTRLGEMYLKGDYIPLTKDDYIDEVIYILTHINPNIVIHRITGDAPKETLLAPSWANNKKLIMNEINKIMETGSLFQGKYYRG